MWHKHEREPRFNCRLCDARYMRRTLLEEHYKNEHNQSYKAYVCDKCDYATDKKKRLDKHMAQDHSIGSVSRFKGVQKFDKDGIKIESQVMVPMKRGRGRPPKSSFISTGGATSSGGAFNPNQDLTHIRPPQKKERTFYSSDEDEAEYADSDEDLTVMDEDDYDWKPTAAGLSAKKAMAMMKRGPSKRGRKPKRELSEIYVPKSEVKEEIEPSFITSDSIGKVFKNHLVT